MQQPNDLSRSLIPFCQESTLIAVVDMSQSSWLVAGIVPGVERHPLKKLDPDQEALPATDPAVAGRGGEGWPDDHSDRPRVRGRP